MERILKKLPSLKTYFMSENWVGERFRRLNSWFANPLLEPALLFNSAAISILTNFNRLLQREEPTIHLLNSSMENLGMKLAKRIIKPIECRNTTVAEIDLSDDSIHIDPMFIFLGGTTKFTLNRLLNSGSITESQFVTFYQSAHENCKQSPKYILQKFPIEDEVICNSVWIDVENRINAKWENVQFFCEKYQNLSTVVNIKYNELCEEVLDYHSLGDDQIGAAAWSEAKVNDGKDGDGNDIFHYRVDVLWYFIAQLKLPEISKYRFKCLPLIAEIVLLLSKMIKKYLDFTALV